ARIRVDVALEAEFTAQNVLYDDFVVGESGLFKEAAVRKLHCAVRVARVGIIGHDRSGSRFDRRFERWYMIVIKAARCRIWIEAAPRIMGIMPPVPCTPAWEMLRRNGYTPVPQSVTLEATHNRAYHPRGQFRVLTECTIITHPQRVRCDIRHIAIQLMDACGTPFFRCGFPELLYKSRIESRRHAEFSRPQ